ncbi:MAG: C-terminal helicase domain-containing protein, partial [Alphaproteobacteria bacterium]|nr:C-terminal helicase domain-containing protein [Alphaproteobacteria bacterium]
SHGFNAAALHGDMHQSARMETLEKFRNGEIMLLIASDVAARGLDVPNMSHVFNFDVPMHADDYIHRIGRTGRAGKEGHAFTLATRTDEKFLDGVERLLGRPIPPISKDGNPIGKETSDAKSSETSETEKDEKAEKAPRRRRRSSRSKDAPSLEDTTEVSVKDTTEVVSREVVSKKAVETVEASTDVSETEPRERPRRSRGGRKSNNDKQHSQSRQRNNDQPGIMEDGDGSAFGKEEYTPAFLRR